MAGEVYIADKPTLDLVKQDTNFIKGQFPLKISGGTDWSKYKPLLNKSAVPDNSITTIYNDFLSITGSGFITALLVKHGYLNTNYLSAQIIIDDVIYYDGVVSYLNLYSGLSSSGFYMYDLQSIIFGNGQGEKSQDFYGSLPINTDTTKKGVSCRLSSPIFFNSNLKVKLKFIGTPQNDAEILLMGGII